MSYSFMSVNVGKAEIDIEGEREGREKISFFSPFLYLSLVLCLESL